MTITCSAVMPLWRASLTLSLVMFATHMLGSLQQSKMTELSVYRGRLQLSESIYSQAIHVPVVEMGITHGSPDVKAQTKFPITGFGGYVCGKHA